MKGSGSDVDSAQLYTLEGLAAAVVLLLAMTYALNAFVVTPTTDVTPGTENNRQVAEDLLATAAENNATGTNNSRLKQLLLNWNATEGGVGFNNSTQGVYYYEGEDPDPEHLEFGKNLQTVLTENGISYNLEASFSRNGTTSTVPIVDNGEPTTSALSASRSVVLLESDEVTDANKPNGTVQISNTSRYVIPKDPRRTTNVYNQAVVRITVW